MKEELSKLSSTTCSLQDDKKATIAANQHQHRRLEEENEELCMRLNECRLLLKEEIHRGEVRKKERKSIRGW